jgi:hypothetical protein
MSEKVVAVIKHGFLNTFRPLNREDYEHWYGTIGFSYALTPKQFYSHDNSCYLHVLLNDLKITIITEDRKGAQRLYNVVLRKGFTWDNASVPKRLRGLVDDNHPNILIAAICHDVWYLSWTFDSGEEPKSRAGCRKANRLFREIIRYYGGKDIDTMAYLGVALAGWNTYKVRSDFDRLIADKYCGATDGDIVYGKD